MSWRNATIAPDGTHHLAGDGPLYGERFDEVLKFHEPGLAPVRRGDEAWHICPDGTAAYPQRFQRTFGFYDGLAAVVSGDGWHHIRPDGTNVYAGRYAWCGNFQDGRCAVRRHDGRYVHIGRDGAPAYEHDWRYAGDFRDGVGVVQADDGRSTHIDRDGGLVHGRWFLDLDVFHKGFARARDEDGWMHVDARGRAAYARRFAAVEPFYNGQARVERFDGGLEVIDEAGRCLVELRAALRSAFAALSGDMVGFWKTETICTAVELGVFDALPGTVESIAQARGLVPGRTLRLLRALAEIGLVERTGTLWQVTEGGAYLQAQHPLTLADAAREYGRHFPRMWASLPQALRQDGGWRAPEVFGEVAMDQERVAAHHRMLQSYARHDYAAVPDALKLRGDELVIDAGGGLGVLARMLLARHPGLRVVLIDRPEVVEHAGSLGQEDRLTLRPADLFAPWEIQGDAVVMSRVLHDWDDDRALRLLRHARDALPVGGRLFVVEMLMPEDGVAGSLCDLHLLMATGGRERTATELTSLLERADFALERVTHLPALPSLIVGEAR
jgi:hypothetical protein